MAFDKMHRVIYSLPQRRNSSITPPKFPAAAPFVVRLFCSQRLTMTDLCSIPRVLPFLKCRSVIISYVSFEDWLLPHSKMHLHSSMFCVSVIHCFLLLRRCSIMDVTTVCLSIHHRRAFGCFQFL